MDSQLFATPEGTKRFAERFRRIAHSDFYREVRGLTLSTLGIGSYLGEPDDADDSKLKAAVKLAVGSGINVIDTAINYRAQRSERAIGAAVRELLNEGTIKRDEIFIATKGGFIPFDGDYPRDARGYFQKTFIEPQILTPDDVVAGCHSLSLDYLEFCFERSRQNLGIETLDLYYLHNPEIQLDEVSREEFSTRMREAFAFLSENVKAGALRNAGVATWSGFLAEPSEKSYLSLSQLNKLTRPEAPLAFIQLPVNLAMTQAITRKNQNGRSILDEASRLGVAVMTSSSLAQGKILGRLPESFELLAPGEADSVKALNYVRSAPGVAVALCGMKETKHVIENIKLALMPRVSPEMMAALF